MTKKISKEAEPFVKILQQTQDEFAAILDAIVVTTDTEGNLITEMSGIPKACKIIRETEEGLKGCQESYAAAVGLFGKRDEPYIGPCHAGFTSLWIPLHVKGKIVGSITGCGGLPADKTDEEITEEYGKFADQFGIEDKEKFIESVINKKRITSEEEIKRRISLMSVVVSALIENTCLQEIFG